MNAALQLAPRYESPAENFLEAQAIKDGYLNDTTVPTAMSSEQLLEEQLDELQGLVADLRGKLELAQSDISQKEMLLHSYLRREMELRIALKGAWRC